MSKWLTIILASMALMACSSGGDETVNTNTSCSSPDVSSYFETPGEKLSYAYHLVATYTKGQNPSQEVTKSLDSVSTENYGVTSTIPAKYAYSGAIAGPYTLNVQTKDCALDGFDYESSQGDNIIEDDLTTFKSGDAQTTTGTDEPKDLANVVVGDQFSYSEDSTLFDSTTGQQVGKEVITLTLVVLSFEEITLPAGTYNAVKFDSDFKSSKTIGNITDTADVTGLVWVDVSQEFPLKLESSLNMTLNLVEPGLTAVATAEQLLTAYNPGPNSSVKLMSTNSSGSVFTSDSIINNIKQTLLDI